MPCTKVNGKWKLAKRRNFELSRLRMSLYYAVRKIRKMDRDAMSLEAGIGTQAWRYRENAKEQYRLGELCALKELSGLTWDQFGQVIESCCGAQQ